MIKKFAKISMLLFLFGVISTGCFGAAEEDPGVADPDVAEGDVVEEEGFVPEELRVQFVPSQAAETLEARAKPLEDLLSNELGIPVRVSVSTDYNTVVEAMGAGQIDVGFLPPTTYVLAHEQGVADVLLQSQRFGVDEDGNWTDELVDYYNAMVVVMEDSDIHSIEDLAGQRMAWQNVTSSAGFVWPYMYIRDHGLDPERDIQGITLRGHDTALIALLNDDVDAAAVFQDARNTLRDEITDIFDRTRVLFHTEPIPNDTIAVRPDMSEEWKDRIADAFIAIGEDEEGNQIIRDIYSHEGYVRSDDATFDIVREYTAEMMGMN